MKNGFIRQNWVSCCHAVENAAWRVADWLWPLLIALLVGGASLLAMNH